MNELSNGTQLQTGKYTIEGVIGAGGFGITYLARHNMLGRQYAIKEFFLNGHCVRNTLRKTVVLQGIDESVYDKYRQKFIEEAQILASLDHQNIVKVVDIVEENNTVYIVMPLLKGQTLQQSVEREGRLKYEVAVNYIAQLSEAVSYIHERNILHRDIKPDNVIILPDNRAILIDFGSAREFIQDKTAAHTSLLTVGYAPLEQYSANSRKGSYTDIYSLGATFYFALTGEKPMDAAARTTETMPEPQNLFPDIPNEANRTIMKAMALKPDMRYQRVDEFMNDLLNKSQKPQLLQHKTTDIQSNIGWNVNGGGKKKNKAWLALFGVAAVALFILLIPSMIRDSSSHSNQPATTENTDKKTIETSKMLTANEIQRLREARNRANDLYKNYVELNDPDILKFALEQCNKALAINPDDRDMLELKKKITRQ